MDSPIKPITLAELRTKRDEILSLAEQYHAFNVRVFGSVAREEASAESDIDFLVDFRSGATIWDAVGLWRNLSVLLNRQVNVIAEEAPEDQFMQSALRDAVPF